MTFLNLLGLLGLLSVLILAIIYIIKPKYLEKAISSSFIWKLSLKYKKRKVPFDWIKSSFLLILQILILLVMTAILMKPNAVLETESGEKIVILDISASMLAEKNGITRLEKALSEIDDLAATTINNNDKFSLIVTGQESNVLVHRTDSYEFIKSRLYTIESNYSTSDINEAMLLTEDIMEINPSAEILFYTSDDYQDPGVVKVQNMSNLEWNVSILDFKGEYDLSLNYIFTVEIASFGYDINDVVIQLDIDGSRETSATLDLVDGVVSTYTFKIPGLNEDTFDIATIKLLEITDNFEYDNQLDYYSPKEPIKIQILSPEIVDEIDSTKEYITRAIGALQSRYVITTVNNVDDVAKEGFDLYIYIETVPTLLPQDGAIWIFNAEELPAILDMTIDGDTLATTDTLSGQSTPSSTYNAIMENVRPEKITVAKYKTVSNIADYEVLLYSNDQPILLTRQIDGVKVFVFNFSLAYSNLPILFFDFPVLVRNLSNYSVIPTFENSVYDAGQDITLYQNPMTDTLTVTTNDETTTYSDFPVTINLSEIGTYEINQYFSDGRIKTESFYVRVPIVESDFDYTGEEIISPAIPDNSVPYQPNDNLRDLLLYFSFALLILVIIEWEVQHREQY